MTGLAATPAVQAAQPAVQVAQPAVEPAALLARRADRLRAGRTPFVQATVVRVERPASARAGDRALIMRDGTVEGFVGGTCAVSTVRAQALRLLESGESTLLRISPEADRPEEAERPPVEGMVSVTNHCLSGGTLDVFLEAVIPPMLVQVFGDGPIARALAAVGAAAGYHVEVAAGAPPDPDDAAATASGAAAAGVSEVAAGRAEAISADAAAVVVATHGRDEERLLAAALRAGVPYVGLIASVRRGSAVASGLEGGERVHTPAGLDIGARTAGEIALSVVAEILSLHPRPSPPA